MDKPCSAKDVIQFSFNNENLIRFLDYLELKNKESNNQINELKNRLVLVESTSNTLKQQLPVIVTDFEKKLKAVNDRADSMENKMNHMGRDIQKLQEFEMRSKDKIEVNSLAD